MNQQPTAAPLAAASAEHPIRLHVTDDLQRNRLTVFFRLILAIPHLVWLALWGVIVYLAALVNWFATLFTGRSPDGLHNFIASKLRYFTHVEAYMLLLADPFPDFGGKPGYPIDLEVDPAQPQSRVTVFFRIILVLPAWIISSILSYISRALAFFSWFIALFTGRVPEGLRNFGAFALRFQQQTMAYALLLTDKYPNFNVGVEA
jgi:hypothetical protein